MARPAGRGAAKRRRTVSLRGASTTSAGRASPSAGRARACVSSSPAACSTTSEAGAWSASSTEARPVKVRASGSRERLAA